LLKVGYSKILKGSIVKVLDYNSVDYKEDGFANVDNYTPNDFDLCLLITKEGLHKKGWWTGQAYWGHRLLSKDCVVGWKKCKDLF
jgi:hypothetical protein